MAKLTDFLGRPHSGLMSNMVVGLVVDNVDPDELGRIKVKFPTLHEEPLSFWMRQATPNAGKERGFYALPEIEDEIMVQFMQGSQDVGVVVGHFWNGVDVPPPEAKDKHPEADKTDTGADWSTDLFTYGSTTLDDNDRRLWKSRSGHLFLFDDTKGAETFQIWDKDHILAFVFDSVEKRILLTNTEGDIHIRTKKTLYLEAGKDIKYHAKENIYGWSGKDMIIKVDGKYEITVAKTATESSGQSWETSAGTSLTETAKTTATFKGMADTKVGGGGMASLKSSGVTSVQGGVVKLN